MLLETLAGLHEATKEVLKSTIVLTDDIDVKDFSLIVGLESPYSRLLGKNEARFRDVARATFYGRTSYAVPIDGLVRFTNAVLDQLRAIQSTRALTPRCPTGPPPCHRRRNAITASWMLRDPSNVPATQCVSRLPRKNARSSQSSGDMVV